MLLVSIICNCIVLVADTLMKVAAMDGSHCHTNYHACLGPGALTYIIMEAEKGKLLHNCGPCRNLPLSVTAIASAVTYDIK